MKRRLTLHSLAVIAILLGCVAPAPDTGSSLVVERRPTSALPLHFESNRGQAPSDLLYLIRGRQGSLGVTDDGWTLAVAGSLLRARFLSTARPAMVTGGDPLPGHSHYYRGQDRRDWVTGVPHFARVEQRGLYEGVSVVYKSQGREIEYDVMLDPGVDPSVVRFRLEGARRLRVDTAGALRVSAGGGGEVLIRRPVAYQEGERRTRVPVDSRFVVRGNEVGFALGEFDPSLPLVIDPVLTFSTYLGGAANETGQSIAVDTQGNVYVAGETASVNLGGVPGAPAGLTDAFVAKLDPSRSQLLYLAYLGGAQNDTAGGIAVDHSGNAYVVGNTFSNNFPVLAAFQNANAGNFDAFVAKLGAGGALSYSSYLGGNTTDFGRAIALDGQGRAWVTGETASPDFPMRSAGQPANAGLYDAFVSAVDDTRDISGNVVATLAFSTYLGGAGNDLGRAIAVGPSGLPHVAGLTFSANFPTQAAFRGTYAGGGDGFVTKFQPGGAAFNHAYSTYLGGSGQDYVRGIAVDSSGNAYVTGATGSTNFPTLAPLQPLNGGGVDAFVTSLSDTGFQRYSTYLGGSFDDEGYGIAVDASGQAFVAGTTDSPNFPTVAPIQANFGGGQDGFVALVNPAGFALSYSTFLGGSAFGGNVGDDGVFAIATDGAGGAYVTGYTSSADFPSAPSPRIQGYSGGDDSFVAWIGDPTIVSVSIGDVQVAESGGTADFTVRLFAFTRPALISVDYAVVAGGTATPGADYTAVAGSITFGAGETTRIVSVPLIADDMDEPEETFFVELSNPQGTTLARNRGQGSIVDDDPPPAAAIDDRTVAEWTAVNAAFRVVLSNPSSQTVTVGYTTANGTATAANDFITTSGTLTFTPGRTRHAVAVPIVSDMTPEGTETFSVSLSSPTNATLGRATATGTILDPPSGAAVPMYRAYNLTAHYHFFTTSRAEFDNAVAYGYRDESTGRSLFHVLNTQQPGSVAIHRMYNPNNGRHYYTANAGERDFLMGLGWIYEKDEGFMFPSAVPGSAELFRLYNNISGVHLYTIDPGEKDAILAMFPGIWEQHSSVGFAFGEPQPVLSVGDASVTEGNSGQASMTFTMTLSPPSARTVTASHATADGSARAGADYVASSGSVTFTPGATSRTVTVAVVGDILYEPGESFRLRLTGATNAVIDDREGAGAILDDDALSGCFAAASSTAPGTFPNASGVAAGDFDGDGVPDIAVAMQSAGVGIQLLTGTGGFGAAGSHAGAVAHAIRVADFNGDGRPDVATIPQPFSGNVLSVRLGTGGTGLGGATGYTIGSWILDLDVGDIHDDAKTDIMVVADYSARVLPGDGSGAFGTSISVPSSGVKSPYRLALGDVNGDGRLDVVTGNRILGEPGVGTCCKDDFYVSLNMGGALFQAAPNVSLGGRKVGEVALGDFSGDGIADLVYFVEVSAQTFEGLFLLKGLGNGTFESPATKIANGGGTSLKLADVDYDGDLDVVFANSGELDVLPGTGDGSVGALRSHLFAGSGSTSLDLADVNRDGRLDFLVGSAGSGNVSVLLNGTCPSPFTVQKQP